MAYLIRKTFYDAIRPRSAGLFDGLTPSQVRGIDAILDEAERRTAPIDRLAYMLATTYHETAATMAPIHERGSRSYFDKYERGTRIGRMLGNTQSGDGYRYRGRGFVQLTGRRNYELAASKVGVDLILKPDLALDLNTATRILFEGMEAGWFTGKALDDYLDGVDENDDEDLREFVQARRIINGTDKADKIGRHALAFEKALRRAAVKAA